MKIEKVKYFDQRFYEVLLDNGTTEYYPSVTTKLGVINKPGLNKWRGDVGNREADMRMFEAGNRGTRIHNAWECYCNNGIVAYEQFEGDVCSDEAEYIMQYQDEYLELMKLVQFDELVKPEIVSSEQIVYSHKHKEAGTLDNLMRIKGGKYMVSGSKALEIPEGLYVTDLKTGVFTEDAWLQLAAYAAMIKEMQGLDVDGAIVLHTKSTNKGGIKGLSTKLRTKDELLNDYEDFRAVSRLWERQNKNITAIDFQFPKAVRREHDLHNN